jgi:hypothetical protein
MSNIDELRKIKGSAPTRTTHIIDGNYYRKHRKGWRGYYPVISEWKLIYSLDLESDTEIQSIADITTIIEQADENTKLKRLLDNGIKAAMQNADKISEMQKHMISNADCIDELIKLGVLSSDPQVEMDAMTDGMRYIANKKAGDL